MPGLYGGFRVQDSASNRCRNEIKKEKPLRFPERLFVKTKNVGLSRWMQVHSTGKGTVGRVQPSNPGDGGNTVFRKFIGGLVSWNIQFVGCF